MRKLFTSIGILIAFGMTAQDFCGTTEMQNEWFSKNPELKAKFDQLQNEAAALDYQLYKNGYKQTNAMQKTQAPIFTIPVVFHILHTGGIENISDAQVLDAVRILNEDFNRLNSDTSSVVAAFKNIIGDAQVSFSLAGKDPQGNCTNGIIRHWDPKTNWTNSFSNYIYSWPSTRYLNIYVVKTISSGAAGYTYLPGSGIPGSADAIVILNTYVGSMGTGNAGTSRALTHEVGHWLNLPHTWGGTNQPGVSCGDDGVSDTPVTKGFTSCNLNNANICNSGIVENMQNYMDYAYCQRMFTTGQAVRMQNALNSSVAGRNNLSTPGNLSLTGVVNPATNCVTKLDIVTNATVICTGQTATLKSFTSNATPLSYSWSTNGFATIQNPTSANATITYNLPGVETVQCLVTNSGGNTIQTFTVLVVNSQPDITSSMMESFEDPNYQLPVGWTIINNTTPNFTWEIFPYAASNGYASMLVPGEQLSANSIEILESPGYDFKNNPNASFTFKYAYAKQSTANKDLFKVQASSNCGGTWSDIYVPNNSTLAQNSGGITSNLYLSPQGTEWKFYDITLHPNFIPFKNQENVKIRFYFQEDVGGVGYGNRFYLDEVAFHTGSTVGINELTKAIELNLYPNPASSDINLAFTLSDRSQVSYKVLSVSGAEVVPSVNKELGPGSHVMNVDTRSLSPGVYFIEMVKDGVKMSRKLVIQ